MVRLINLKTAICSYILAAGLLTSVTAVASQQKEQDRLAALQLDINGNGKKETVELYGKKLTDSSEYKSDLLLLLKDDNGDILTAYVPSIKGGYACILEKASFVGKGEQLILSARQGGDDNNTEYRIIDFSDIKAVKEIFTDSNNVGVSAQVDFLPNFRTEMIFSDGKSNIEMLPGEKSFYEERGLYAADGTLLKNHIKPHVTKINSLMPVDLNQDGTLELLTLQSVTGLNNDDLLGKLTGVWEYSEEMSWQLQSKTFYSGGKSKDDKFHRSYNSKKWSVFPRQVVYDGNNVTYPLFITKEEAEVQDKINDNFATVASPYLQNLSTGDELDYTLTFVGDKFISLVFFGVMNVGENEVFAKMPFNIDVQTGKALEIGEILNTRDDDLLSVLRILTQKDKVDFSNGLPQSWYYNGTNFVFCQRDSEGNWLEAVAAAVDLKKFLLRPELF